MRCAATQHKAQYSRPYTLGSEQHIYPDAGPGQHCWLCQWLNLPSPCRCCRSATASCGICRLYRWLSFSLLAGAADLPEPVAATEQPGPEQQAPGDRAQRPECSQRSRRNQERAQRAQRDTQGQAPAEGTTVWHSSRHSCVLDLAFEQQRMNADVLVVPAAVLAGS